MLLGKRIRELRQEHGLRQNQLAKSVNVAANTLSQFESGKANPGYEALIAIADYFEVTTDYLLGRADDFGKVTVMAEKTSGFPDSDEKELLSLLDLYPISLDQIRIMMQTSKELCGLTLPQTMEMLLKLTILNNINLQIKLEFL